MAIKGSKREDLTIETVLSKTSEFYIYSHFMPNKDWELDKVTFSPFKEEKVPSFIIGTKYGNITHKAFNDDKYKGDCFKFVQQIRHLSNLNEVLEVIDSEMSLGIRNAPNIEYSQVVKEYKEPVITKRNTLIQVKTRPYTDADLAYWGSYYQDIKDIKQANIYSIKELYINKKRFPLKENELRFGYYFSGRWKVYIPNSDNKRRKWLSNIPLTESEGLENLKKEYNSLILKSKKDYLVARKIYPYCAYVQNESLAAFSKETVEHINNNSKEVYCCFDSDAPGKKASLAVTAEFGWKHINSPDNLLPDINDIAMWAKVKGLEEVKEHFIKKGLYE